MTLSVWQRTIVNTNGDVIGGASVEVRRESDDVLITLFSTPSVSGPTLSNPAIADSAGFVRFYAAEGAYRITATSGAFSAVWRNVQLGTAQRFNADQNLTTADNVEFAGLNVDNVFIDGNSIGTATGEDLLITPQGNLLINADIDATGTLDVIGRINVDNLRLDGSTISSTNPDNIVIAPQSLTAQVTGSLVPTTDDTYDLGSGSLAWRNLNVAGAAFIPDIFTDSVTIGNVEIVNDNGGIEIDGGIRVDTVADIGTPGTESAGVNIAGTDYTYRLRINDVAGTGSQTMAVLHKHSTTDSAIMAGVRSNSDTPSHANVTQNMPLFDLVGGGWATGAYRISSKIALGTGTGTISATSMPGKIEFSTAKNEEVALTTALTIDQAQNVTAANKLTQSGQTVLDEADRTTSTSDTTAGRVARADHAAMLGAANTFTAAQTVTETVTGTKFIPTGGTATGNGVYLPATNALAISTDGVERVRVDSDGNFLIGTTLTGGKLRIRQTVDDTTGGLTIYNTDGLSASISKLVAGGLTFRNGGAERMSITTGGNVLVNTSVDNGTDRLQVNGTASTGNLTASGAIGRVTISATDANQLQSIQLQAPAGPTWQITSRPTDSALYFCPDLGPATGPSVEAAARVRFYSSGRSRFGTGADNGTDRLQVDGSLTATTLKEGGTALSSIYGRLASGNTWTTTNSFGGSSVAVPMVVYRDTNAGDSTNAVSILVGNLVSGQGAGLIQYTNAAANGAPRFRFSFQPRNDGDTAAINPAFISMDKVAGANTATIDINCAGAGIRVGTTGRVMLGTTTDNGTDRLQVSGSAAITGTATVANATADGHAVNRTTADGRYGRLAAANTWTALNTFSGRASFTYSGDAGVSTCSVIRSENDTDARVYFAFARGAAPFSSLIQLNGQGDGANGIDQLRFASSAANIMALTQAGRTLLGTTTDNGTDRLQVTGSIRATTGIRFADAGNLLANYTEGTWTPTDGSGAGLVLGSVGAVFTRIGREVICKFALSYPVTADASDARINGLPIAVAAATHARQGFISACALSTIRSPFPTTSGTFFNFRDTSNNNLTNADLSGLTVVGTLIYYV